MNAASCPPSSCVPSGAVASRKVVFQNNDRRHHLPPGIDRYFGYIEACEAAGMLPEDKSELAEIPLKHGLDGVATVVTFLELFKANNADWEQEVRIDNEAILPRIEAEPWAGVFFENLQPDDLLRAINVASHLEVSVFMHYASEFVARKILDMTIPEMRAYLHTQDNMSDEQWQQIIKEPIFKAIVKKDGAS